MFYIPNQSIESTTGRVYMVVPSYRLFRFSNSDYIDKKIANKISYLLGFLIFEIFT